MVVHVFHTGRQSVDFQFTSYDALLDILRQEYISIPCLEYGKRFETRFGILLKGKTPNGYDDVFLYDITDLCIYFRDVREVYWVSEFPVFAFSKGITSLDKDHLSARKHKIVLRCTSNAPLENVIGLLNECFYTKEFVNSLDCSHWKVNGNNVCPIDLEPGPYRIVSVDSNNRTNELTWNDIVSLHQYDTNGCPMNALFYVAVHVSYSQSTVAHLKLYLDLPTEIQEVPDEILLKQLVGQTDQKILLKAVHSFLIELRLDPEWNDCIKCFFGVLRRLQLNFDSRVHLNPEIGRRVVDYVMEAAASYSRYQIEIGVSKFDSKSRKSQKMKHRNIAGYGYLDYFVENALMLSLFEKSVGPICEFEIPPIPDVTTFENRSGQKRPNESVVQKIASIFTMTESSKTTSFVMSLYSDFNSEFNSDFESDDDSDLNASTKETKLEDFEGMVKVSIQGRDCLFNDDGDRIATYCYTGLSNGQSFHFMGVNWSNNTPKAKLEYFGSLNMPIFPCPGGAQISQKSRKYVSVSYIEFERTVAAVLMMITGVMKTRVISEYNNEV